MARIIVEGMDHDNTRLNYYIDTVNIPLETGVLKTWGGRLAYYGQMKNGKFEEAPNVGCLEVTVSEFPLFESTQTIILEDGRVFYSVDSSNKERLEAALNDIFVKAGSFDSAYRQIEENPGKFLRF